MFEIITGFPVWMAYKGRIIRKLSDMKWRESGIMKGILGETGR